jgi:hypothetical protein
MLEVQKGVLALGIEVIGMGTGNCNLYKSLGSLLRDRFLFTPSRSLACEFSFLYIRIIHLTFFLC